MILHMDKCFNEIPKLCYQDIMILVLEMMIKVLKWYFFDKLYNLFQLLLLREFLIIDLILYVFLYFYFLFKQQKKGCNCGLIGMEYLHWFFDIWVFLYSRVEQLAKDGWVVRVDKIEVSGIADSMVQIDAISIEYFL